MARQVTFLHAADLHIGAPFKGLRTSSEQWAEKMMHAVSAAFERVIDIALYEHVDFVVMPGDLFDNSHPSFRDFSMFTQGIERLNQASIPVYFCNGNHDPYVSWENEYSSLPENMHCFSAEKASFFTYEKDGEVLALLGGRGFLNASFPADDDVSAGISKTSAELATGKSAPFMVGVMHSGLDIDPTRAPVNPKSLENRGVDYWALGHVHHVHILPDLNNPFIAYSGAPQGRAAQEIGPHGVLKVTLEEGAKPRVQFMSTASIEWQKFKLDISDCSTIAEIREQIINKQFALNSNSYAKEMIFRVKLVGRTELHKRLTSQLVEDLRESVNEGFPFFYVDVITNETQLPIDEDKLRQEGLFSAVYLEALDDLKADSKQLATELEKEYEELGLGTPLVSKQKLEKAISQSKAIVLDLLD